MKKSIFILLLILFYSFPIKADNNDYFLSYKKFEYQVRQQEKKYKWRPRKKYEGSISVMETIITMTENFRIIDNVKNNKINHPKLKLILDKFDNIIINNKERSRKTFIEMYNYLNRRIPNGNVTKGSHNILEVLDKGGDCNDVSPAFYSLFKYYGFNIWVVIGGHADELHAWIAVEFEKNKLTELDPLWYGDYIELNRIDNIRKWEIINLKDNYRRSRFKK